MIVFLLAMTGAHVKAQWSANRAPFNDVAPVGTSENNPIWIETAGQLAELAYRVSQTANYSNGKYFKLKENINLADHNWDVPIGTSTTMPFQGIFDGENSTIPKITNHKSKIDETFLIDHLMPFYRLRCLRAGFNCHYFGR